MEKTPQAAGAEVLHLERGIVKFPLNVHGIYVDPQASGSVVVTARQNDREMVFVVDPAACEHLASLLTAAATKARS